MPLLALSVSLLAVTPGPPAPGAGGSGCHAPGAHTLATSRLARVFSVQAGDATFVYGCARPNQRRTLLGVAGGVAGEPGPRIRLAGATVAVIRAPRVKTLDLRTGGRLRAARVGEPIGRVVLRRDGSFGAIARGRVIKVDGAGRTVADRGPGVEPGSLRLAPTKLRWRNDGRARAMRWVS